MRTHDPPTLLTAEEFQELADEPGYRLELVRGMVVRSPGPGARHGEVQTNLVYLLGGFVKQRGLGKVLSGGSSYILERGPDTVRGPDISFIPRERLPAGRLTDSYLEGAPALAIEIEILSPSNRPGELRERLDDFFRAGCHEVWVLDSRRQRVTVHWPDGMQTVLRAVDALTSPLLPGFRCRVAELFESH